MGAITSTPIDAEAKGAMYVRQALLPGSQRLAAYCPQTLMAPT